MKHLVIFVTEHGVVSAVYDFKNSPPMIEEIQNMQYDMKNQKELHQTPVIINWLPVIA